MNWPECWGHTNSMMCIIPVNKMSPCAGVFVQNVLSPFFQPLLFSPLPFCYSYYKCVIEFRKWYDRGSVSALSWSCIFKPLLPCVEIWNSPSLQDSLGKEASSSRLTAEKELMECKTENERLLQVIAMLEEEAQMSLKENSILGNPSGASTENTTRHKLSCLAFPQTCV